MGHLHHGHVHEHEHAGRRSDDEGGRTRSRSGLTWTLGLTIGYMVAEVVGGYASGSLALLADAGHMLSDAAALGLSLFAAWIAQRPPTPQHSYGYYRAEILAALANGATLIAIAIIIFIEAVRRLSAPEEVAGPLMMGIAAGGLVVNILGLALLHGTKGESLNIHGAWLHLLADALGSVATLAAGGSGVGVRLELGRPGGLRGDRPAGDLFVVAARQAGHLDPDGEHAWPFERRRRAQRHDRRARRLRSSRPAHLDDHQRHGIALGPRHARGRPRAAGRARRPAPRAARRASASTTSRSRSSPSAAKAAARRFSQ